MKTQFKRGFSFILALMMVVSLLSGLPVHVHAENHYSYIEEEGLSVTDPTTVATEAPAVTEAPAATEATTASSEMVTYIE